MFVEPEETKKFGNVIGFVKWPEEIETMDEIPAVLVYVQTERK